MKHTETKDQFDNLESADYPDVFSTRDDVRKANDIYAARTFPDDSTPPENSKDCININECNMKQIEEIVSAMG